MIHKSNQRFRLNYAYKYNNKNDLIVNIDNILIIYRLSNNVVYYLAQYKTYYHS